MGLHRTGRERQRYLAKVAAGVCPRCGQHPPSPGRKTCDPCRTRQREMYRAQQPRQVGAVVSYPKGALCSIAHAAWLRGPVEWAWSQPR